MSSLFKRRRTEKPTISSRIHKFINHIDVTYGKAKGYAAKYQETDTKTLERELKELYEELHGESVEYDNARTFLRQNVGLIHRIQALFDLELQRMGREEEFIVNEPRAIAFIYSLLTEPYPNFTTVDWTENQVRRYIETGVEPHDEDAPNRPFIPDNHEPNYKFKRHAYPGKLGGKRTKRNTKSRKNRKSNKKRN